jgi:hypothetical protein
LLIFGHGFMMGYDAYLDCLSRISTHRSPS